MPVQTQDANPRPRQFNTRKAETTTQARKKSTVGRKRFIPMNEYDVSSEVRHAFEVQGYGLRWVRGWLEDTEDYKNISRRMLNGWVFVTQKELEPWPDMVNAFETRDLTRGRNLIVKGDTVLMKCPMDMIESVREYYEEMIKDRKRAMSYHLANEAPNLNRAFPISNESETRITRGTRNPAGFGETLENSEVNNEQSLSDLEDGETEG